MEPDKALLAHIEERRKDAPFMERLRRAMVEHKPLLDKLSEPVEPEIQAEDRR